MQIERIDHLVLTVRDVEATISFYASVLGLEPITFGDGRRALAFGTQKLNLHEAGRELEPKAARPTPGSGDICFIADAEPDELGEWLAGRVEVEEGPVARTGALGPMTSFYFRDPDGNLVEVATYP